ncbi:MAG: NifB/NifX family molybdenum-iron cluster-binding protein [Bilifractor sp.]
MAGRQEKTRQVGTIPEYTIFSPEGIPTGEEVTLSVDEFEVIRLLDLEHMTQSETADQMHVARTTVTAIYDRARTKLADSLVNGKQLRIEGGNIQFRPQIIQTISKLNEKGEHVMRIAVTYDNGNVFQHFGRTEQFKFYDVEDGKVTATQVTGTNGAGHGALAEFLKNNQVDTLICGGIGGGAQSAMQEAGIKIYGGVSGNTDEAVTKLLEGTLAYDPNVVCSHHEGHHGNGQCGSHGNGQCGNHGCHN